MAWEGTEYPIDFPSEFSFGAIVNVDTKYLPWSEKLASEGGEGVVTSSWGEVKGLMYDVSLAGSRESMY